MLHGYVRSRPPNRPVTALTAMMAATVQEDVVQQQQLMDGILQKSLNFTSLGFPMQRYVRRLPSVRVTLLTATTTAEVQEEVMQQLRLAG